MLCPLPGKVVLNGLAQQPGFGTKQLPEGSGADIKGRSKLFLVQNTYPYLVKQRIGAFEKLSEYNFLHLKDKKIRDEFYPHCPAALQRGKGLK
ncbi:hypothetical protein GCM10011378_15190 [Hymenobacter glacieicola]|uniref:Uncharacterized protein n=1 Tax=Hymenobacter glacieicola TaxID=1562124 RepID=A0ABQ1WPJ8_9BACT|nr:hypothetical protein GCM10011378_15190 [Hymenobacter glacieicola]